MRITDLCDDRTPADSSARRRRGSVRPPSPKAPIRRKLRRDSRCEKTDAAEVRPWWVGIDCLMGSVTAGLGISRSMPAGAGSPGGEVTGDILPHLIARSMKLRGFRRLQLFSH